MTQTILPNEPLVICPRPMQIQKKRTTISDGFRHPTDWNSLQLIKRMQSSRDALFVFPRALPPSSSACIANHVPKINPPVYYQRVIKFIPLAVSPHSTVPQLRFTALLGPPSSCSRREKGFVAQRYKSSLGSHTECQIHKNSFLYSFATVCFSFIFIKLDLDSFDGSYVLTLL
ncbi:hypothetical protein CDAR_467561 [Caerostris darwini]|uniref:Uncharacterized protein n=1 Tax=Caerostris darwini TaxID=1538125 RepID=A0AAV4RS44_9ARAC|nr:hypothetical protein CDAR_467561 [Caerostris darwini]